MKDYVANRLRELCRDQGITKYRLAQLTNLSQTTLANIMNAKSSPTIQTLELICDALGISVPQFFHSTDPFQDLSDEQQDLLKGWSGLNEEKRRLLLTFIHSLQDDCNHEQS